MPQTLQNPKYDQSLPKVQSTRCSMKLMLVLRSEEHDILVLFRMRPWEMVLVVYGFPTKVCFESPVHTVPSPPSLPLHLPLPLPPFPLFVSPEECGHEMARVFLCVVCMDVFLGYVSHCV